MTEIPLRDYQVRCINAFYESVRNGNKRVIFVPQQVQGNVLVVMSKSSCILEG